jgi:hypothetical protein
MLTNSPTYSSTQNCTNPHLNTSATAVHSIITDLNHVLLSLIDALNFSDATILKVNEIEKNSFRGLVCAINFTRRIVVSIKISFDRISTATTVDSIITGKIQRNSTFCTSNQTATQTTFNLSKACCKTTEKH